MFAGSMLRRLRAVFARLRSSAPMFAARPRRSAHEIDLATTIQELILTLRSGATLEDALVQVLPAGIRTDGIRSIDGLERYAVRVNDKEIWRFVRLVSQYRRNGSPSSMDALEKYHDEIWMAKLGTIRKKAEEVSLKLTLLLMLSLISIVAVVMTPVLLLFGA